MSEKLSQFGKRIREACAILFWTYLFTRLIFNVDDYLINRYFPDWAWLLRYKLILLIALVSVLWILIGRVRFPLVVGYILVYPLFLVFWRFSKLLIVHWPVTIAFAPAVYELIRTFRLSFMFFSLAACSAALILSTTNRLLLEVPMVILFLYLTRHLYRAARKSYQSSMFAGLAGLIGKLVKIIEGGDLDKGIWKKVEVVPDKPETKDRYNTYLTGFYVVDQCLALLTEKLNQFARSGLPDLYLIASWAWTVVVTTIIFGFEYLALYRLQPSAFLHVTAPSIWAFLGFSFGKLTPSGVSPITPETVPAVIMCYAELGCSLAVLIILFFIVLTASRERYHGDIDRAVTEVERVVRTLQQKFTASYGMAIPDIEVLVLVESAEIVEMMRDMRGLPMLQKPTPPNTN